VWHGGCSLPHMAHEALSLWRQPESNGGREAELSVLLRELDEARSARRARFVFVRGPSGVGKSHLFRQLRLAAGARGVDVFEAESAREARRPFGLFTGVCRELLAHLGHAGTPAEKLAAVSHRLLPLLGPVAEGGEPDRLALFDAACELFVLGGAGSPVFLLPDLDAADPGSLELFRYLAAVVAAPESRAGGLFVASFRDDGPPSAALAEVLGKVRARSLPLGGLDLEGIRGFLGRREVAERLFAATGGMPDALEALLTRQDGPALDLFLHRAERLEPRARAALCALCAADGALCADAVAGVLQARGEPAADAPGTLDGLVQRHIVAVRVAGGVPVYRFARESERAAFASELGASGLLPWRRALGDFYLASGDPVAAAPLLLEACPPKGAQVALEAAVELSARGAAEEAVALLDRALPHLDPDSSPRVHRLLSELHLARGDARAALRHLTRSRRRGDLPGLLALRVPAARLLLRLGKPQRAGRLLGPALDEAGPQADPARVLGVELALLTGRADEAIALGAALVATLHEPYQLLVLRNAIGRAHLLKGQLELADRAFCDNAQLAQADGQRQELARAQLNRGVTAHKKGDRERAIAFYRAAAPAGERALEARALANLGSLYAESGDFELALDHLSRSLHAFSRLQSERDVAQTAVNLARLYAFLGDLPRAAELCDHALRRAVELRDPYLQASALGVRGEVALDRREWDEAGRLLGEARELFEGVGNLGYAAFCAAQKARAHLGLSQRAQAQAELSRPQVDAGASQMPQAQVEVELCRGELALGLGDFQTAGRATTRAREALLAKADLEGPYRVYFLMGRLRLAAGDMSGAQAEMARAARLLDEVTERVPAPLRQPFLCVPRRAEVLSAVEPALRLPRRVAQAPVAEAGHRLVGQSQALEKITRQLEPIARSNATVLIRGESGTGKEVLAQAIHDLSSRRTMPIVKVNCAAMVEDLLISELFGHEKGAFTGAVRERKGRFELADGGTLFLDEIGDISPKCQVALLRVLQEREFERVGGVRTLKVDVRVICATNRDLESLIAQGRFRQDLYYRLKGVMLELPPLRERLEDLPLLASHVLGRVAAERGEAPRQLSGEALELLARHPWPGNVRELENVLASAAIFADGQLITPDCFSHIAELAALGDGAQAITAAPTPLPRFQAPVAVAAVAAPAAAHPEDGDEEPPSSGARVDDVDFYRLARTRDLSLKELRHQLEMQCIRQALLEAGGNISEAARLLKMKRSRLSQIVNAEPELREVCNAE
jgi:transcriptional regulator with GAF, ATPase, and Fis domain